MEVRSVTPILNVSDVRTSLAWFESLGWSRGFVWSNEGGMGGHGEPTFASVHSDHAEIFLCKDGQGSRDARPATHPGDESTGGVWMAWFVASRDEFDVLHARVLELGYEVSMPPTDQPWNVREFHLRHPDGHTFRVGFAG